MKYILLFVLAIQILHCDKHSVVDFDKTKILKIRGRVIDRNSKDGVSAAKVRFYSIYRPAETIVFTDNSGFYELLTFEVFCSEFVVVPEDMDLTWRPNDRYFISATKVGYDTLTSGAFFADIHCFDIDQIVNMSIIHLNHQEESVKERGMPILNND